MIRILIAFCLLYHDRPQTLNFDSARQSSIAALHLERGSPYLIGKGNEERRLSKVAASQNSKFEADRGIASFGGDEEVLPQHLVQVQEEIVNDLLSSLQGEPQEKPIIILIAGYPGAGKTTLAKGIKKSHEITIVATDAIRQLMLDKQIFYTPYDSVMVYQIKNKLLSHCLKNRYNILLDSNAHAMNLQHIKELLNLEKADDSYVAVKIYLEVSKEVLLKRVNSRHHVKGIHQGNEADVLEAIETKKIIPAVYDLIINTEKVPFEDELDTVNEFLKPYFDRQACLNPI